MNNWLCESCGYVFKAPWPKDREKYYANPAPRNKKCPKCKSTDTSPKGY